MSRDTLAAETEALRRGAGAWRARRDVIAVHGPDATAYLQGQLSQDVEGLTPGASADSLLLEPDGKLSALVRVSRVEQAAFLLDVDGGYGEPVVARLRRFLLRSKVELEPLAWRCLCLRGGAAAELVGTVEAALRQAGGRVLPFSWNGWAGFDLLGPDDAVPGFGAPLPAGATPCGEGAVEACRIVSGIPAMGAELTGRTIAAEADLVTRTVDFAKGCYTGQELVARIDARGSKVARRLVGIVREPEPEGAETSLLTAGMTLHAGEAPSGDAAADDKVVGTVTSAAWSVELGAWVGLAYLHRSVPAPGPVRVRSGDGVGASSPARVDLLPLPLPDVAPG